MKFPTIHNHSAESSENVVQIANTLRSKLIDYNRLQSPASHLFPVILSCKDDDGTLRGGLVGRIAWDWLHIELLWLDETLRGRGAGTALIEEAENIARQNSCLGVYLDTFSFQAPQFYEQRGYRVFGKIDNQPQGHCRYFLQKTFSLQVGS